MIRLQIINLFLENQHPEILTQELDDIERVREPGSIFRKPIRIHQLFSYCPSPHFKL